MGTVQQRYKVLGAGIFSLLLGMGIARFAYTPMLPLMQEQAGLGMGAAGLLAAVNYFGYLGGALLASRINSLQLKDRLYRIGMVVGVVSTWMMGMSTHPVVWLVSRFIAGFSSAAAILLGSALILNWLIRHNHRSELGIHFSGIGLGIAGCSAVVILTTGILSWQEQWYVFTLLACVMIVPALAWLPSPDPTPFTRTGAPLVDAPPSPLFLKLFMAAYFCAGIGYVVSATFTVAIIDHMPGLAGKGNWAFLAIGLAAAPACINWDLIARRTGEVNALIMASLLQIVGIVLPVFYQTLWVAILSAMLFGGTFIGMVSLVLTMAGKYYPTRPAKMMGKMTLAYGVAQIIGPAVTGWLGKTTGSYNSGLFFAAAAMVVGSLLLILLRSLTQRENLSGRDNRVDPCQQQTS
jgi:predicted MFS family arabinose efflux permease